MAITHVCPQCGHDLARLRPRREPHYNLKLIICTCGWATTRAIHPIWRNWRWFLRLAPAVLTLAGQAFAVAAITTASIFAAAWIGMLWLQEGTWENLHEHRVWLIWPLLVVPIITGAWLRATFGHWRCFTQWLAWTVFVVGVMTFAFIFLPWLWEAESRIGVGFMPSETVRDLAPLWLRAVGVFGVMMIISLAGAPLGKAITIMHASRRRTRWRRRRRRLRAKGLSA